MDFMYMDITKSLIEMGLSCSISDCDGHMSAGEHMCNQNMQDNDMQLSEYNAFPLQI